MIDAMDSVLPKAEMDSRRLSLRNLEELVDSVELPAAQADWLVEQLEWSAEELKRPILPAFQISLLKLIGEEEAE